MTETSTRSRLSMVRLVSLFAILCMAPLALLTYLTIDLADQAVVREVDARVRTTSAVTAVLVQQQMQAVAELTASYASRPVLINAVSDGNPAQFQRPVIDGQLSQLEAARPGIGGAFLTDINCRLTQVEPASPTIVGVDYSFRDWCKGVKASGRPYVSEAYQTAILGHPLVVAAAAMVRPTAGDAVGRPLAILAVVYTLDAIRGFADQVARVQGIHLTITDQHGTVLVGGTKVVDPKALISAAGDPRVRQALAGRTGVTRSTTANGDSLSAFAPVAVIGWTVTAEVPASQALAGVRSLRSTVLSVAGLLGLVLLAGLVLLVRTLRLRRQAERTVVERDAHTRAILEAATDAFVSMNAAGVITGWNEQARQIFGWTETEACGRLLSDTIIPLEFRADHERGLAEFLSTGEGPVLNQRIEVTALHRDGHQFPAELAIWPVRSGDGWSFNAFVQNITERKRAETDLADARDQALAASQLKSEFLANMSHEIRTPMNGVLGMTSLLLDTDLTVEQREFAQTVRSSGEGLLVILNDILDFSKIEAGRLDLECIDFDLRGLVEDVASLLSLPAHHKGLELACSLPVNLPASVRGDPGRLRQIVTNLVGNAIKFTPSGEVLLELTVVGCEEHTVTVSFQVVDTGIGIAPADQAGLFESFSQVDAATTRRYGGTGLGLAISRQLVELMGGHIGVHSEMGHGSTFWFTVPLLQGQPVPAAPNASLGGLRMLVVDDNATNRAILTRFLHSWGIRSQAADGAGQALEAMATSLAEGDPFDVALLDLNMPDVNGIELARRIAANADFLPLKMVLLTSSGQPGEAGQAREAGIAGYLTKPVRQSLLYDCLASIMDTPAAAVATIGARNIRPQQGRPGPAGRILLAEDNPVNQRVAGAMLEKLGFQVDIVADGAQAVAAATVTPYQAILMDCQMPVLDGYQATNEIRRLQGGSRRTPIIAVTASAMKSDQQRCLAAGMDDHLAKPISLHALAAVLARWAPGQSPPTAIAGPAERVRTPFGLTQATDPGRPALDAQVVGRLERLGQETGEDLMGQLAVLFLAEADTRIVSLHKALADGDAAGIVRSAHTLSGASANLGATDLGRLCATLATESSTGDLVDGETLLAAVKTELGRVRLALGALAPTP